MIGWVLGWRTLKAIGGMVAGATIGLVVGGLIGGPLGQATVEKVLGGTITWWLWCPGVLGALVAWFVGAKIGESVGGERSRKAGRAIAFFLTYAIAVSVAEGVMSVYFPAPSVRATAAEWFWYWTRTWAGGSGVAGVIWGALIGLLDIKLFE